MKDVEKHKAKATDVSTLGLASKPPTPAADAFVGSGARGKTHKLLRHQLRRSGDLNLVRENPLNKREDVMCLKRTVVGTIGALAMLAMAARKFA